MIDATGVQVAGYVATAVLGIVSLSFASVGFWLRNLFIWERLLLLAGAITLITPGLITDAIGIGLMVVVYLLQKVRPTARHPPRRKSGPVRHNDQGGFGPLFSCPAPFDAPRSHCKMPPERLC